MNYILLAIKLLPALMTAAATIEAAIPQSGAGAQKLDIIKAAVMAVYDVMPEVQKEIGSSKVLDLCVSIVTKVVAVMNTLGLFSKKGE